MISTPLFYAFSYDLYDLGWKLPHTRVKLLPKPLYHAFSLALEWMLPHTRDELDPILSNTVVWRIEAASH